MKNLTIDPERLWDDLMETARIGATPKGGICRLTLTDLDRQVRDWFKARVEALGCTVAVDDMGTMFARRPGQRADIAPIAMGSHLDTQPTGGKFDGALGVLAALEALRTLHLAGYETFAPIEVVNWTNEEGARFAPAMIASGVFAGVFTRDWAAARADRGGETFGAALEKIGYRGPEKCGNRKLSAFFELHIEQGPYLEAEGKAIGVVTGVQAMRWYEVTVIGQDTHAGTTPMARRHDALLGAARLVETVNAAARKSPTAVGTVGLLEVKPGAPNVVPGEVFFMIDMRDPDPAVLDRMEGEIARAATTIGGELGLADRAQEHLDAAAADLRSRLHRRRARRRARLELFHPRHDFRRRPRRGLCRARRAGRDDLRAVQGRHQPQRGGIFVQGAMRRRRAGAVAGRARLRPPPGRALRQIAKRLRCARAAPWRSRRCRRRSY